MIGDLEAVFESLKLSLSSSMHKSVVALEDNQSKCPSTAESILHFKKNMGHTWLGKAGFGYTPIDPILLKGPKDYRKAASDNYF